jgi:hypothetical protein
VSGGSRCNVTNTAVSERDFWGGRSSIVRRVLRAFPVHDTIAFFREIGIRLHEEPDGKLFPDSNRSRDVLEALLRETHRVGVTLLTSRRVHAVVRAGEGFHVTTSAGDLTAPAVVLATGGRSLPKTGSDGAGLAIAARLGHTIVPTTPGLVPILLGDHAPHREVSGVSQDVELTVWIDGAVATRLAGALLWTHFGVSGPAAMNASRHYLRAEIEGRTVSLTINFCPGDTFEQVERHWMALATVRPKASLQTALGGMISASVAAAILKQLAIDGSQELAHLTRDDRRRLAHALVEWPLPVVGTRGYNFAEVTAGGVALTEVDPATMASRTCLGLYLVGEILDVDGRIGGFNFQWAWSSGYVAGKALARAGFPPRLALR